MIYFDIIRKVGDAGYRGKDRTLKTARPQVCVKSKKTNANTLSKADQAAREYFGSAFAPQFAIAA